MGSNKQLFDYIPNALPTFCWHTSLQVKAHNQNDRSVTNQIEYTDLRTDSYL